MKEPGLVVNQFVPVQLAHGLTDVSTNEDTTLKYDINVQMKAPKPVQTTYIDTYS